MIALLALRLGLQRRTVAIGLWVMATIIILASIYLAMDAYGDARYDAGREDADAEWKAASERLEEQSRNAATDAEREAVAREREYLERLEAERNAIDETVERGGDPFDVLFPPGV